MSDISSKSASGDESGDILQELRESLASLDTLTLPPQAREHLERACTAAGKLSMPLPLFDEHMEEVRQESMQERAQFISTMTHELRLPLTSIKGYTDLLLQGAAGPVNEQQMSFLTVIRNNVDRMTALISNLSDISRLDNGWLKMEILPLGLVSHLEKALQELYPNLHEKSHRIHVQVSEAIPPVLSDPVRLNQILTSLIRNACMYTPENGLICIRARCEDGLVRLEVIDNGIGIRREEQSRLFTPFFRSDNALVREQQGWGLSLYVVSRLVDAMGGESGAISHVGEGSTFWVTLPAYSIG